MSKFFKSLLLLLTAGLFTATGWAADSLIARWDNFDGLAAGTPLKPSYSATVEEVNSANWQFNLGGGTVANGVLATGTKAAPNIAFGESINLGYYNKILTILMAFEVPFKNPTYDKPIVYMGAGNGIGLALTSEKGVRGAYNNTVWNDSQNRNNERTVEAFGVTETQTVYLLVCPTSSGFKFADITNSSSTIGWNTISGLQGTSWSGSNIYFGNFGNAQSGGLNYNLKSVAVFRNEASLDDIKDVLFAWGDGAQAQYTAEVSVDANISEIVWTNTSDSTPVPTAELPDGAWVKINASNNPTLTYDLTVSNKLIYTANPLTVKIQATPSQEDYNAFIPGIMSNPSYETEGLGGLFVGPGAVTYTAAGIQDGYDLKVIGDRAYLKNIPSATLGIPSFGVNFYNDNAAKVAGTLEQGAYSLKGEAWTDVAAANGTTSTFSLCDAAGKVTENTTTSLTLTGAKSFRLANMPSSALLKGYIDDNTTNSPITLTFSNVPYEKYRVIVYMSTDSNNFQFAPVSIGGVSYAFVAGSVKPSSSAWGNSGPQDNANDLAEGVNYLVSPVLTSDTCEITATRSGNNRATFAAVQFIDCSVENRTMTLPSPEYTYTVGANDPWGGETPTANAKITINFGGTENKEVDLTTALGEITEVAELIVTGTNGGMITKTGAGAVTATTLTIEEGRVAVAAGALTAASATIEKYATLAIADVRTIAAVQGEGTLEMNDYPAEKTTNWSAVTSISGFTADAWKGTLKLNKPTYSTATDADMIIRDGLRFDLLGNANSTIEITEGTTVRGYFGLSKTSQPYETWTATAKMVINGTLHSNNGFSAGTGYSYALLTTFSGALTGSGTIKITNDSPWDCVNFTGDISSFEGAMVVSANKRSILIGTGAAEDGKIIIAGSTKLNANWSATHGFVINLPAGQTLDLNGQNVTLSELNSAGTIIDTAETKGSITVQGGAINVTGSCSASVTVDLSTYYSPTTFVVPENVTLITMNQLPYSYLTFADNAIKLNTFEEENKLSDELIWLPVGDSITEGEQFMGHEDRGNGNTRGGYRYQLWKLMEALGQQTRTVGFRNGHNGKDKGNCGVDHSQARWGWHAALYGGDITGGSSGAQLFNVESALETAGYPDVISILIGINDLSRSAADGHTEDTFDSWVQLVTRYADLRPKSKVLAATLLPTSSKSGNCGTDVPIFNEMIRNAQKSGAAPFDRRNVMLVDLPTLTGWDDAYEAATIGSNFVDGLHPSETGSVKVAAAFQSVMRVAMADIADDPLTIVHVHNAVENTLTVRLNKAITSVNGLTATITGTNFAGKTVEVSLSNGVLDENNKRVIIFALNEKLVNGTYTVTVNGTVNRETLTSALTATGVTVEILGTGAAQNVKPAFLKDFKHRKTYTLAGTNDNVADAHMVADGVDAEGEISAPVKVGYYMELQRAGQPAQFIWVSMDAFADAEKNLGIPTVATGYHKTKVSNLDVFANRGNFLKEVAGGTGVIEFTPWSWTDAKESLNDWPEEQGNYTGWNDKLEKIAGTLKGCMQVARIREESTGESKYDPKAEMLFAYNNYNCATMTDVGIGSFATHRTNVGGDATVTYDWTDFSSETGYTKYQPDAYTVRKIELWVAPALVKEAIINVGQYTTWSAAKKGLNLADEMESLTINFTAADQNFTFDETVTIGALTVQGKAGTIAKEGDATVTVATTTADANVTVNAGVATLGAVTINANATIKVADAATITSAKGAGTLHLVGVANEAHGAQCIVQGLADSTNWNGHVILESTPATNLLLSNYGNEDSKITLRNITGYLDYAVGNGQNSWPHVITVAADVCIEGTNTFNNGYSNQVYCYTGKLIGNGVILHNSSGGATHYFEGDVSEFKGSIKTEVNGGKFIFGNHDAGITVNDGQIIIAKNVTIAQDATWKATNGISVTGEGTISGTGTLSIPSGKALTYESTAESTFGGKINGAGGLTVSSGTLKLNTKQYSENNNGNFTGENFTGDVTVDGGTLTLPSSIFSYNRTITVNSNGTLALTSGDHYFKITGGGNLVISGITNLGVAGDRADTCLRDFTGTLTVESGTTTLLNWQNNAYSLSGCKVVVNGELVLGQKGKSKSLSLSSAISGTGQLTINTTNAFRGSLEGLKLKVDSGATATLTGNSTVSTIAGAGTLTVQGATLTLTSPSTFDGTLSVGLHSTLTCEASLTIQKTLQFVATQAYLKTTKGAQVTIAKDATIIPNAAEHAAKVELENGAIIDLDGAEGGNVTDGELKVDEVILTEENGIIYVKATNSKPTLVIETGTNVSLPSSLSISNFALTSPDATLHFFLDKSENRVALVKVKADLTQKTEEERQAILALGYQWGVAIGEIENPGVEYVFDGKYGEAYTYVWGESVEGEGEELFCNLYCFVNFGISGITDVNTQCIDGVDYVVANVIATVEPMVEGASVSFKNGVKVALYLEGQAEPLETEAITKGDDDADVRQVIFKNVQLPARNGTHKLTVRALKN